ncbi:unnamed protein product [Didymodactylos carnosus]|uniref:Tetratricopeptide repeat protein 29 n=1 Tax=Didymodactylos carnosus TaxID=1234261 RepID=A0A814I8D7_9BILA|nr:unnamed protein product [Didymodactylos carnosus]CAF1020418.1 unnamed protein product [Didymodactylos carnosus]CAF3691075.1 unnamed protein product [Didymodactylos carnosus]CAF3791834.1 unnamed protein product [Didymodactylos carnosus]
MSVDGIHEVIGNLYKETKQFDLAIKHFNKSLTVQRTNFNENRESSELNVLDSLAECYEMLDDYEQCVKYYTKALALTNVDDHTIRVDNIVRILILIGTSYALDSKLDLAVKWFDRIFELDNQYPTLITNERIVKIHECLGNIYTENNDYTHAIEHYSKQLELLIKLNKATRERKLHIRQTLAELCKQKNDLPLAIHHYKVVLTLQNQNFNNGYSGRLARFSKKQKRQQTNLAYLHYSIADCYEKLFDYSDALTHYKTILELKVIDQSLLADAHIGLGTIYENSTSEKNYLLAIKHYKKLVVLKLKNYNQNMSNIARYYTGIGWCYCKLKENKLGLKYCEKALNIYRECSESTDDPCYTNVYATLACLYYQINNYETAWIYCDKSIAVMKDSFPIVKYEYPIYAWIYEVYGCIYLYFKDKYLAIESFKESMNLFQKHQPYPRKEIKRIQHSLYELRLNNSVEDEVYEPVRKKSKIK